MPQEWPHVDDTVRPSSRYRGCFYCPRCECTYTPGMEWGTVVYLPPRGDTSGRYPELSGIHRKGDECPYCGRKPGTAT